MLYLIIVTEDGNGSNLKTSGGFFQVSVLVSWIKSVKKNLGLFFPFVV